MSNGERSGSERTTKSFGSTLMLLVVVVLSVTLLAMLLVVL
jgi:hypothetical protein